MRAPGDTTANSSLQARYAFERELGQGGNGVVYCVRDRETGERLALKKLLRMEAESVLRLKREFRALADLHHRNLVRMYDMERAEDTWFITMEYVDGCDLKSYIRPASPAVDGIAPTSSANWQGPENLPRVLDAFQQLAAGVTALHRVGLLHRDLKPSNVLVEHGRVVVLDFGLIRDLTGAGLATQDGVVSGTPAYMAPEQARGTARQNEASDWYAFGVMLYEALSGELPITGNILELLQRKGSVDPKPLDTLAPHVPQALSRLCMALLLRDPGSRPSGVEIRKTLNELNPLRELSVRTEEEIFSNLPPRAHSTLPLFGRDGELKQLDEMFTRAAKGGFVAAHVRGISGSGKSALVERFLSRLELRPELDALLLRGRCYEREAMPFKALDGLMESLVRYLDQQDDVVVSNLLPAQLPELTRAFPVLARLRVVGKLLQRSDPARETPRERARAEEGLRELLTRVAEHWTLVLWIDDLQWGDLDSAGMLKSLLESPLQQTLLLFTYRGDELSTNACLDLLLRRDRPRCATEETIDLAPLHASDVEAFCKQRLGAKAEEHDWLVKRVIAEAHGSPFLISQLLTMAQSPVARGAEAAKLLSIDGIVAQARAALPNAAQLLLRVLAVAGRPLPLHLALRAAEAGHDSRAQLQALRALGLTRVRIAGGQRLLEIYHDRIREAVCAELSADELQALHRRLLSALELSGHADPDWLHQLALGADMPDEAFRNGILAADRAASALAWERAAELYRLCIELRPNVAGDNGELWLKLAVALASGRHGPRAAEAYLEAAQRMPDSRATELIQMAATHLVRSGYFEEGEALFQRVLLALKIDVPRTELGLLAAIGWERARLRLRGLEFRKRTLAEVPPEELRVGMAYASMSVDTQAYDPLRAALFQARSLRIALEHGVPELVGGALALGATMHCFSGDLRDAERAYAMLDLAEAITRDLNNGLARARIAAARAVCAFLTAQYALCVEHASVAARLYDDLRNAQDAMAAEYYHRFAVVALRIGALFHMGELRKGSAELEVELEEGRRTGNVAALLLFTLVRTNVELVHDRAEEARQRLIAERTQLPAHSFGPFHLLHLSATIRVAAATGDFAWGHESIRDLWARFQKSQLRRGSLALLALSGHARMLLNEHVAAHGASDPGDIVSFELRALKQLPDSVARASRTRIEARIAFLRGQPERALALYRENVTAFEQACNRDEQHRALFAVGQLVGGDQGAEMIEHATRTLAELGIVDPLADLRTTFPELFL